MAHKKVNPTSDRNNAISVAAKNNHHDIVKLLWEDKRVKKSLINDNETLYDKLIQQDIQNKIKSF